MEIAVYIHVPFCIRKCYYCDFVSFPYESGLVQAYLEGLAKEMELYAALFPGSRAKTLYFGGGTPSCLAIPELAGLLQTCRRFFPPVSGAEVTVEVNPGTFSREKLAVLREGGVNRISLGVQALQDEHLASLGRIHRVADFYRAYDLLREAGLNISLDLMFALPGQTLTQWEETLNQALALEPEHISTYNLVFEEGTPFHRWREEGELAAPPEELDLAMYQLAREKLMAAGYRHYEISNFARPGRECWHNLVYWRNESYLGFGPGAHSHYQGERWANQETLEGYLAPLTRGEAPVAARERLTPEMELAETVILGLRLVEGIGREAFRKRFGRDLVDLFPEQVQRLVEEGLLEVTSQRVRLSPRGLLLANQVFLVFLPD